MQRWFPLASITGDHLSRPLDVCQNIRLSKLQDKQIGFSHRKTEGVFQSAVCSLPCAKNCLSFCYNSLRAGPTDHQSQVVKGPWATALRTGAQDVKTGASHMCTSSSPGYTGALEFVRGRAQRWHHSLRPLERIIVNF